MGANIKILTLGDALQHGFQLRITCGGCKRSGIYATINVIDWFRSKRLNTAIEAAGYYLRCTECGHKGAAIGLVAPHRAPDLPQLKPSAYEQVQRARRSRG